MNPSTLPLLLIHASLKERGIWIRLEMAQFNTNSAEGFKILLQKIHSYRYSFLFPTTQYKDGKTFLYQDIQPTIAQVIGLILGVQSDQYPLSFRNIDGWSDPYVKHKKYLRRFLHYLKDFLRTFISVSSIYSKNTCPQRIHENFASQ